MAYDHRSQYPYLSEKDWNRYKTEPVKLESLNDFKKTELEEKLENFSLSENKLKEKCPPQPHASDALRLVIIGKTGQGKSATANTILGKVMFDEDFTASSVARESRCVTELVDGRKISVMDTPGLQDTHQSNASILKELARMATLFPDGVHAFVYVMNMADPRFTAEDKNVLDLIEKTFGGGFKSYCLLVFSYGDSALKDVDLDTYREKQMGIAQPTPQNVRKDQRGNEKDRNEFANLLAELSWKMLAIDNKTSIPIEKEHYRKQIVAMVDIMRTSNDPEIYTNDMFAKAQQEREDMRLKGLKKGWDPSIMSKVKTILAANPSISREELKDVVIRQLQEEVKEISQKEKRERQERPEREDRDWQLRQERQEREKQERFQTDERDKRRKEEEKEENETRQQRQQKMWEDQVGEIADELRISIENANSGIVSIAKKVVGWIFNSSF